MLFSPLNQASLSYCGGTITAGQSSASETAFRIVRGGLKSSAAQICRQSSHGTPFARRHADFGGGHARASQARKASLSRAQRACSSDGSSGSSRAGSNGARSTSRVAPSAISCAMRFAGRGRIEDAPHIMSGRNIETVALRHPADQRQAVLGHGTETGLLRDDLVGTKQWR